jgi:hypothetical protein
MHRQYAVKAIRSLPEGLTEIGIVTWVGRAYPVLALTRISLRRSNIPAVRGVSGPTVGVAGMVEIDPKPTKIESTSHCAHSDRKNLTEVLENPSRS